MKPETLNGKNAAHWRAHIARLEQEIVTLRQRAQAAEAARSLAEKAAHDAWSFTKALRGSGGIKESHNG